MGPIEQILHERNIFYRISGNDLLIKCLNPEHEDRNPSMRVDRIMGLFNCFSCGYKGSVLQYYNIDYSESSMRRESLLRRITELRSESLGYELPEDYIPYVGNFRGIKPQTFKKFEAFRHHAKHFADRINFPIRDISGRIVGFQGRDELGTLDNKYQFHPSGVKLPLFPNKVSPIQGRVILVEGLFDMLNLYDKGLENVVCCFGTNTFTSEKLAHLKLSGVVGLDLFFDPDEAGARGMEKIKEIAVGFPIRVVKIQSGDPGDLSEFQVINLRKRLYAA